MDYFELLWENIIYSAQTEDMSSRESVQPKDRLNE
jgi:hypothetical protein